MKSIRLSLKWSRERARVRGHVIIFITSPLCCDCTSVHFAQQYFYNCNPVELEKRDYAECTIGTWAEACSASTQGEGHTGCAVALESVH